MRSEKIKSSDLLITELCLTIIKKGDPKPTFSCLSTQHPERNRCSFCSISSYFSRLLLTKGIHSLFMNAPTILVLQKDQQGIVLRNYRDGNRFRSNLYSSVLSLHPLTSVVLFSHRNVPLVAIPLFRNHIAQKVSSNGLLHIISIADPDGHWSKCFMWCPLCYCRPGKFTMIPWILYLSVQVSSV